MYIPNARVDWLQLKQLLLQYVIPAELLSYSPKDLTWNDLKATLVVFTARNIMMLLVIRN